MRLHFPSYSPDGQHLLGESGDGWIVLDGTRIGQGYGPPCWVDATRFIYSTDAGVFIRDINGPVTPVHPKPLIELAACPTAWAGRDPQRNVLVVSGREIPNAGQPAIAPDGHLEYREGDLRIEPSLCRQAAAWGDGVGGIHGYWRGDGTLNDYTVAAPEYRPRCVDTPAGPWLLTMTHTALRLRPFGQADGFVKELGDNQNLNAHVVCVGRTLKVVCQAGDGTLQFWEQSIDAPRAAIRVPIPAPVDNPPPPTPQEPPVSAPDLSAFYDYAERRWHELHATQRVSEQVDLFFQIVWEWWQSYPNVGLLRQAPGRTNHKGMSEDYLAVKHEGVVWSGDVVSGINTPNAAIWRTTLTREERQDAWAEPPVPESGTPAPNPGTPPPADDRELRELREEVRILREHVDILRELHAESSLVAIAESVFNEKAKSLNSEIANLKKRQYTVRVGRSWGHTHEASVEPVK